MSEQEFNLSTEEASQFAMLLHVLIGREKFAEAKTRAFAEKTVTRYSTGGELLGGKVTITIEFDGREGAK